MKRIQINRRARAKAQWLRDPRSPSGTLNSLHEPGSQGGLHAQKWQISLCFIDESVSRKEGRGATNLEDIASSPRNDGGLPSGTIRAELGKEGVVPSEFSFEGRAAGIRWWVRWGVGKWF